jgi:hypothetical protein
MGLAMGLAMGFALRESGYCDSRFALHLPRADCRRFSNDFLICDKSRTERLLLDN